MSVIAPHWNYYIWVLHQSILNFSTFCECERSLYDVDPKFWNSMKLDVGSMFHFFKNWRMQVEGQTPNDFSFALGLLTKGTSTVRGRLMHVTDRRSLCRRLLLNFMRRQPDEINIINEFIVQVVLTLVVSYLRPCYGNASYPVCFWPYQLGCMASWEDRRSYNEWISVLRYQTIMWSR